MKTFPTAADSAIGSNATATDGDRPGSSRTKATLVLGGQMRIVAAVARSLGAQGIPVVVAAIQDFEGRVKSRFVRAVERLPHPREGKADFQQRLIDIVDRHGVDFVVPATDPHLACMDLVVEALGPRVRYACPGFGSIERVLDKTQVAGLAQRAGLSTPRRYPVPDPAALDQVVDDSSFPLFAKSKYKTLLLHESSKANNLGFELIPDRESLKAQFELIPDYGAKHLLEEYLPGHDVLLAVLMQRGSVIGAFQATSLRTMPASGGVTTLCRSENVDRELVRRAEILLREIGWEGVAQLDFRRESASGRIVLLEINGRMWGSVTAAIKAGMDFPYWAWQCAHDEAPKIPPRYPTGMLCRCATETLKSLYREWRNQGWPLGRMALDLGGFTWDFRPGVRGMYWSWSDPHPAWDDWFHGLSNYCRSLISRLVARRAAPEPVARPDGITLGSTIGEARTTPPATEVSWT